MHVYYIQHDRTCWMEAISSSSAALKSAVPESQYLNIIVDDDDGQNRARPEWTN